MALSTTRDFNTVRNDIIDMALRKIGAIAQHQIPTQHQYSNHAKSLNAIVKALQSESVYIWDCIVDSILIIPNTQSYELQEDILWIDNPFVRIDDYDRPITLITHEEYSKIRNKSQQGNIVSVLFHTTLSKPTLYVHPTGIEGVNARLYFTKYLKALDYNIASDTSPFPSYWTQTLIYLLAYDISSEYGVSPTERKILFDTANNYKMRAIYASKDKAMLKFRPKKPNYRRGRI